MGVSQKKRAERKFSLAVQCCAVLQIGAPSCLAIVIVGVGNDSKQSDPSTLKSQYDECG